MEDLDQVTVMSETTEQAKAEANGPARVSEQESEQDQIKSLEEVTIESTVSFELQLSAVYLDDALTHRNMPFAPTRDGVRMYGLYKKPVFQYLLFTFFLVDVGLAFFEEPARDGWLLPYWASMILELCCIAYFVGRMFHELLISESARTFWKDTKHITSAIIIALSLVDIVIYFAMRETSQSSEESSAVRWSRPLRPFLVVNFPEARQIRRAFRNIRRTIPDLANVLVLFLASVALFSLMAVKLFQKRDFQKVHNAEKTGYFKNFFDSYWDLFVLVTTANSPDIIMPSYDSNSAYVFFFLAFLIVNLYLFMRVFLAVVYNSYKNSLKSEVREAVEQKRRLLSKSFELLRDPEAGGITKSSFFQLMHLTRPEKKHHFWDVAWTILDEDEAGRLTAAQFANVLDLMHMRVVNVKDKRTMVERWFPEAYNSAASRWLIRCVRHIYFRYLFDFIIFLNAIFIAFDLDGGEPFFLTLFTLEIVLKLYAFGFQAFVRKMWNVFDVVVVGSALIITIVLAALDQTHHTSEVALDFLMVLRVIRIFKIFHTVTRFRIVINTILHILPSMATYGGVLLVFYYFFAIIGMELFANKIKYYGYSDTLLPGQQYCGNYRLQESEFYKNHYCKNNFNDLFSSLVTLFWLMVVNQWHVITEGHVLVTSSLARLYFFIFHFVCVTVILNIFSAFVIEAFILEFALTSAGRRPQSPLTHRMNAMGLGYGSRTSESSAQKQDQEQGEQERRTTDHERLVDFDDDDDDFMDADHGKMELPMKEGTAGEAGSDPTSPTVPKVKNMAKVTSLRFHLTSRTRTVMGLLEKMFENEIAFEIDAHDQ